VADGVVVQGGGDDAFLAMSEARLMEGLVTIAGTHPMLTVREVATALGMSEPWVRKGCADGTIPAIRVGQQGAWRIARAWVERVLDGSPVTIE
jgi:excisionase family DNA binding protein